MAAASSAASAGGTAPPAPPGLTSREPDTMFGTNKTECIQFPHRVKGKPRGKEKALSAAPRARVLSTNGVPIPGL